MGMTGIEIFKLLPKTNCGECGVPTCLAFAMGLASGKAELEACPYVSEEAKEQLAESSAPPVRPLTVGTGDYEVKVGGVHVAVGQDDIAGESCERCGNAGLPRSTLPADDHELLH